MSFYYPLSNPISQYFGANPHSPIQPWGHYGVDFAAPVGTPVRSVGAGVVRFADWNQKMGPNPWQMIPYSDRSGIVVLIDHGAITTMYAHLSARTVNAGQTVKAGDIIGNVGNTGYSFGAHLHLEMILEANINGHMYGRVNPLSNMSKIIPASDVINIILKANQRRVGPANLNQRNMPTAGAKVIRTVPANTIEEFQGYVNGETVTSGGVTSKVWYKDSQGYIWAGGFTSQATTGLKNLTAEPELKPNQRKVRHTEGIQRATPYRSGKVVRLVQANTIETFTGYVRGEMVDGNNVWFKDSIGYIWSGGFLDPSTKGLNSQTVLEPTQRLVASGGAIMRKEASQAGEVVRKILPHALETFKAYVRGQNISSGGTVSDIWYRDAQGYVWAGGFTSQSTTGLVDQTPKPVEVTPPVVTPEPEPVVPVLASRTLFAHPVNLRKDPVISDNVVAVIPASTKIRVAGWAESQFHDGSNVWFKNAEEDGWVHSSTVLEKDTKGLAKLDVDVTSPILVEVEPPYNFTPDFDFVEYKPANTWNMQDGNFPANPAKLVLHQFDAKEKRPSLDGVIAHFQTDRRPKASSAHFSVSGDRIVQHVSLKDRAFHAGTVGNDYIGIEIDPQEDAATVTSVKKLIGALNTRYNKVFTYTKHRDVPGNATDCGADIHLEKYAVTTAPVLPNEPTADEIAEVLMYLIRTHTK